jgi:hypothetical protein
MKFSKPINREIDIEGNTFIVSFDNNGIDFRLKGKRRTAHVEWIEVFNIAQGEQGANAREFLDVGRASQQQGAGDAQRMEHVFEPQATAGSQPQSTAAQGQASGAAQSMENETTSTTNEDIGRAVSAGETGPES